AIGFLALGVGPSMSCTFGINMNSGTPAFGRFRSTGCALRDPAVAIALIIALFSGLESERAYGSEVAASGVIYTNQRVADVPWSIHIVRVARRDPRYHVLSAHAGGGALGLEPLTDQI